MFDHHIPLNQKERITIVYGVNGIGKTMIMRMVDALMNKQFWELGRLPFEKLILNFHDGNYLKINRNIKEEKFHIIYRINNEKEVDFKFPLKREHIYSDKDYRELIADITRTYSNWHRIDDMNLYNSNKEKALSVNDFMDNYTHLLPSGFQPNFRHPQELSKLTNLLESIKTYFIPTERMSTSHNVPNQYTQYFGVSSDPTIETVTVCSQAIIEEIKTEAIKVRQNQLRTVGLVNGTVSDDFMPDKSMNDINKAIIAVNFQDIQLKLGVFDDIYEKLKLFVKILNNNRLSFKKIQISSERGFIFKDDNGVELTPDQLSSGEQHELIMLYQLLFEVPENALVMIDEPEISHHIMWKKSFVEDILEIIKLRNFDVYVNTHSPSIVNGNWDMTISLREEELVEEN